MRVKADFIRKGIAPESCGARTKSPVSADAKGVRTESPPLEMNCNARPTLDRPPGMGSNFPARDHPRAVIRTPANKNTPRLIGLLTASRDSANPKSIHISSAPMARWKRLARQAVPEPEPVDLFK